MCNQPRDHGCHQGVVDNLWWTPHPFDASIPASELTALIAMWHDGSLENEDLVLALEKLTKETP